MLRLIIAILFTHLLFMPVSYLTQPERFGPPDGCEWNVEVGFDDSIYFYCPDAREDDVDIDPSGGVQRLQRAKWWGR